MMATPRKVTPGIFAAAKRLQASGADMKEIAEYFDLSDRTAYRIINNETYDDYNADTWEKRQVAKAIAAKELKQKEQQNELPVQVIRHEHEQSVTIIANHYMAEELKKHSDLLQLISNKLAFIVDELTGTKTPENRSME